MAGIAAHDVPAEVPAGRALRASDALEVQLGFVGTAPDHAEQRRIVAELAARDPGGGSLALRIRPLPPDVRLDRRGVPRARWLLGVGGDLAEAITVDYRVGIRMVVAGPPRSGRTTLLRSLLAQVVDADVVVAAPARSLLRRDAESGGVPVLSPAHPLPNGFADGSRPAVALVDDVSHLDDGPLASQLHDLVRSATPGLTVIAAGRSDELATTYRGLGAELRRNRCGLLLQPGPADGDILGLRLARQREYQPPGRGILVGEPAWGPAFVDAEQIPIQVARL
jgi:S-DNA-T family DNA segregation ATPase FtsK/SpoIIIE